MVCDEATKTIGDVVLCSTVLVTRLSSSKPPPEITILVALSPPDKKRFRYAKGSPDARVALFLGLP
jgi:hypothetical protein